MAIDIFLKLDGIKGESKDAAHKAEIQCESLTWSALNTGTEHRAGGGGAGRVHVKDIVLTKFVDKASPQLFFAVCFLKHFPEAVITLRKAGETPLEYMKFLLSDVVVTAVEGTGEVSGDQFLERVSLNFARIKIEHQEQQSDGRGKPSALIGYDIKANVRM